MRRTAPGLLFAALILLGLTGCSTSECRVYCNRYQQCIEDDIEVDACTDRCEAASEADRDHESKVEECASCVDTRTCAASFDDCVDDCLGVQGPL
ncbi:lipoprotein [Hyalangium rubrum]|uniref:Lipoprotein n=1 Tax=Hyalangium rubrum TaxID=3103134 RepID=A0ABU5H2L9_9BACT|nr:lipoprotein [Hyalangium sp. s54d21]MDY7226345.1 lipoprotein [Hyalangium sp. s54d21]